MGRYEAVRLLGEGGMGKVYLARQLDLGRQVVVKVMHEHVVHDEKFIQRFQRETMLLAHFTHPYCVALYDASLTDGPCIVMEYVRGINLETLLQKNQRLSYQRVGRLLGQLCEVLEAAHQQGLIHRDLKPANLMIVDHDSPREKIKVMDFGLAKSMEGDKMMDYQQSSAEFAIGTPGYICPEQVRGDNIDGRSDIYSVGVMLYELLTGRLPFLNTNSMDLMLAHATERPPRFHTLGLPIDIPEPIEACVFTCLEKDPNERPQTASELQEMYQLALTMAESGMTNDLPEAMPLHEGPRIIQDPSALCMKFEAWMPESIAIMKIRGFAHDFGGEIVESNPGMVKMKLGDRQSGQQFSRSSGITGFGWLSKPRKSEYLWVELHLDVMDQMRANHLLVQVVFRPNAISQLQDAAWRERCMQSFINLRGYLMGS
ncbi:MAG: serine/threonine-protein kinase [Zavarzinella sp.]